MKKQLSIQEFIYLTESKIPTSCAESWDAVGLITGNAKQKLTGMVVGVDLTEKLFKLALQKKANFIVIHHPPLFPKGKGLNALIEGNSKSLSTLLLQAYKKNICVYVAHTNFDQCALDAMFNLAHDLGVAPQTRIWEKPKDEKTLLKKLVAYIPVDHFERVRDALYLMGCGHIGNYDSCGFSVSGVGNFRPLQGASPFFGKVGQLEEAEEIRFETLVVAGMEEKVIQTLLDVHPYEEVAYDLYPVTQLPTHQGMVWGLGYGFVGELKKPVPFKSFVQKVKRTFKVKSFLTNLEQLQSVPKTIKKIAYTPGSGSSFVHAVQKHKVDLYITGEVGYHASLGAARNGLCVFELGHRESEHYFLKTFHHWAQELGVHCFALDERTQKII